MMEMPFSRRLNIVRAHVCRGQIAPNCLTGKRRKPKPSELMPVQTVGRIDGFHPMHRRPAAPPDQAWSAADMADACST
jgi:hypothetical protein